MEDMAHKSEEVPKGPPSYFSIAPSGLDQLSSLSEVVVRAPYVTTAHGDVVFEFRRENVDDEDRHLFFNLHDKMGRMMIRIKTEYMCCNSPLEVYIDGQSVAKLHQQRKFFYLSPKYVVRDESGKKVLIICTPDFPKTRFLLRIRDMQGNKIGSVTKTWKGPPGEEYDDTKELQIEVPTDLGVQFKAMIIGFCINVVQASYLACTNLEI